jgi:hypothetical protein
MEYRAYHSTGRVLSLLVCDNPEFSVHSSRRSF